MVEIAPWVAQWGYIAVFLGALIEGESIILTASFLASQGYLSIFKIAGIAFLGTLVADQALFYVGRWWGGRIMARFPQMHGAARRAFQFLEAYNTLYILSFRFIYGVRIISPVVIGASGLNPRKFAFLNVVAAAVWSILSCGAGYFFGDLILKRLSGTHRWGLLCILGAVVVGFLGYRYLKRRKQRTVLEEEEPLALPEEDLLLEDDPGSKKASGL